MNKKSLFLLLLTLAACVRNPTTGKREFHAISEKAELNLGEESKKEIIKEYGRYSNPQLQSYINEVGSRLVAVCERKNINYDFVILDTPLVNAFAIPGTVFLTRGILELIDDEAELAAVMGHELGHINGFHAVKLIQKSYGYGFLATFAAIAGTLYTPEFRDPKAYAAYYETLYRGIGIVTAGFLTGYGREFESESDLSGLRYAILAGYDPDAMISFFKRLQSLEDEEAMGIGVFLRTHPPTNQRIKQIKKILASNDEDVKKRIQRNKNDPNNKIFAILKSSSTRFQDHFERYQDIVRSIPKLESDPTGSISSHTFQNSRYGVKLEVPRNWKVELAYGKSLASFFSPDGKAQGELQVVGTLAEPVLKPSQNGSVAGVAQASATVTVRQWAEAIEANLRFEKRTGRDVTYPAGPSYIGTYKGIDRVGRPAFYKILYILRDLGKGKQEGYMLSCAAPEETYLDYLVEFETIMKSLTFVRQKS